MTEAIVSIAVQTIAETIADLLIGEVSFFSDVRGSFCSDVRRKLELLQTDLRQMQSFLKDAENMQDGNKRICNWVAEIRDIAYDAEDITQTFVLKVASRPGGISKTTRFISMFTGAPNRHQIGIEIKSLRDKMEVISKGMQTLGIIQLSGEREVNHTENETRQLLRRSYPHDDEEDVITLQKCTGDLMSQLLTNVEDGVRVVSVVGMGGLGKTTLAKKVFNNIEVRRHFDCLCWAFISQKFSARDVLLEILKQLYASGEERDKWEKMKAEELIMTLYKVLQSKLYLVVLDDIWSNEAWSSLKPAFPNGKKGSKVLFTTRIIEVALHADPRSSPVEPPFLTNEESWTLFCKKAFMEQVVPPEMEKSGKEMLKKSGGLPLAIVVLGGLLASKKSQKERELVLKSINSQFANLEKQNGYAGGVYGILALSYQALPWYLKPCFLYLSQFPENWDIHKTTLIRMWIAEGFISQSSLTHGVDETMENVGEQYLQELIRRSVIQVSQRDHTGSGVKTCRMHDLMRDLCQKKAREENFLRTFVPENQNRFSKIVLFANLQKLRRIAVHSENFLPNNGPSEDLPKREDNTSHIRSLLYFFMDQPGHFNFGRREYGFLFKNFRLLRVLNLRYIHLNNGKLTGEVGKLIYLRYLGMVSCGIAQVPASIGNLQSLYSLDLRGNYIRNLPNVLWKFRHLRHLSMYLCTTNCRLNTLKHLETLKIIGAKALIRKNTLDQLINLQNLGIQFESTEEMEVVLNSSIFQYGRLCSMDMHWGHFWRDYSSPSLEPFSHCQHLTKLKLCGKIMEDAHNSHHPHNLEFLPASLSKLCFRYSQLKQDQMPILEKLPNLRVLDLEHESYVGLVMVCSASGFPQLEYLKLKFLRELKEWRVEEGAMPSLKALNIDHLCGLTKIPKGLEYMTTLQRLSVSHQSEAFGKRIQVVNGVEGEDFYKVKHVPCISITFPLEVSQSFPF